MFFFYCRDSWKILWVVLVEVWRSWILKMRISVRSLRQLRRVYQRQSCVMINNLVAEKPCYFEKCCQIHNSAYRVLDQAELNIFKNRPFITTSTRSISADAVKITNGGLALFEFQFSNCIYASVSLNFCFFSYLICIGIFWVCYSN